MALIENLEISKEQIAKEGLDSLDKKYQKSVGFFAWDFFVAIGEILYKIWEKIIYLVNCFSDLQNMNYDDLKNYIFQSRGISAKKAVAATGFLTVENGEGTIPEGAIFETSAKTQFKSTSTTSVSAGSKFEVVCLVEGIEGNVPANAITVMPTTIQGITKVTNDEAFTNGCNAETKEALLKRYYIDIQSPTTSANIYHYKKWAIAVTGVGDARIKPLWNGDNTVKIVILTSENEIPNENLVKSVQDYIDPFELLEDGTKKGWGCGFGQAPIGAYCTVVPASANPLDISTEITLKSGAIFNQVKENIQTNIKNYLKSIAFDEKVTYVSYAKIGAIIIASDGVMDYTNLKINNSEDNVLLEDTNAKTEVAVINCLNVTKM